MLNSAYEGRVLLGKSITSTVLTLATQMNNLYFFFYQLTLSLVYSFANSPEKKKKKSVYLSLLNEVVCIQKGIPVIWIYYTSPSGIA